jgi:hypothetical protein
MKPNTKSMNEPRGYSGSANRAPAKAGGNSVARRRPSGGRISPWLPFAVGVFALVVVGKALAESDRRRYAHSSWTSRLSDRVSDRWHDWWPEIRDTAEDTGSRARSWLHDAAPSRRTLSDVLSNGSDWLPDTRAAKRRLLENFDWRNPPRWLSDIDLSTRGKRRRFLRDMKRYGSRKSDDLMSSLGLR